MFLLLWCCLFMQLSKRDVLARMHNNHELATEVNASKYSCTQRQHVSISIEQQTLLFLQPLFNMTQLIVIQPMEPLVTYQQTDQVFSSKHQIFIDAICCQT